MNRVGIVACEGMAFAVEPSLIPKIKADYVKGKGSIREICESYGVEFNPIRVRAVKEGWTEQKEQFLTNIAQNSIENAQNEAKEWEKLVYSASKEDFLLISESIRQLKESGQGIDAEAIGGYSRARKLLDDMARRSLGLADPTSKVDVTSGGKSMGENFIEAIEALRAANLPKLSEEEVQRIMEAEIVDEQGQH